jgi:hypothetical protein
MQLRFVRTERRSRLTCVRTDGSFSTAELGPGLPYHDLAHFVVERAYGLRRGFFGHVACGYSLEDLSKKEVILGLDAESSVAEVLARALGSLATGACTLEQFPALAQEELTRLNLAPPGELTTEQARCMLEEYRGLLDRYDALPPGQALELSFN